MPRIDHPAVEEERAHLRETIAEIERETASAEIELKGAAAELKNARKFDPDNLPLREMMYSRAENLVSSLKRAKPKPYFTRIDFSEKGHPLERVYIGKYGVMRSETLEMIVADWRAPVANLYYAGQLGPISYRTPEGVVEGDVTLKRMFGIEKGELMTIFDTDIASQDAYLQSVLGEMTGGRLKEIVTTIQAEQNRVIRHPGRESLIVQGVAGSGKTTIALHRIAYLLYVMSDRLSPENMLILAPNPLFLTFIAGVLPDLGVENTRQSTFLRFFEETVGKFPLTQSDRGSIEGRVKGSIEFVRRLEKWLEDYEEAIAPEGGIRFGPVPVMSREEVVRFLTVDEKPFPYERRYAELKKRITGFMNQACIPLSEGYYRESMRRAEEIRRTESDPAKRMERLNRLYESRDRRVAEMKKSVKPYAEQVIASLPDTRPEAIYLRFLSDMRADADERIAETARLSLERYEKTKAFTAEDIASLGIVALASREIKRPDIRCVVADEAQDRSVAEFYFLRKLLPGAPFTVVGDLMQGMNEWRGLTDWRKLNRCVFDDAAAMRTLKTGYRNTVEIMELAAKIAERHPVPGQTEIKPVLRHGEAPRFIRADGFARRRCAALQAVAKYRAAKMQSIAVLFTSEEERRNFDEPGAYIINEENGTFRNGVALAMAGGVKGLEFDAVILFDAGAAAFPDTPEAERVLYVCVTRALHCLTVIYEGERSRLFDGNDGK